MSKSYAAADIPGLVRDALVGRYGESQEQRFKGYIATQSINELFTYLDPDDVVQLKAERRVKDKTESFHRLKHSSVSDYMSIEEQLKRQVVIDYDRLKHGDLDWPTTKEIIEDEGLGDVAVTNLVYRFKNVKLYDRLLELLDEAIDYSKTGETFFNPPFHAELRSRAPGTDKARRKVRSYNEDSVFADLGWKIRSLDLDAIWSLDAWMVEGKGVMGKGTDQRMVEELAFNNVESDAPLYGAVNSTIAIDQWRKTLPADMTSRKKWEWTEEEEWMQIE